MPIIDELVRELEWINAVWDKRPTLIMYTEFENAMNVALGKPMHPKPDTKPPSIRRNCQPANGEPK